MTFLFDNPVAIWSVGAVLATLCGLAFLARRNLTSLLLLVGVLLLTLLLTAVEALVVTPREEVEAALLEVMTAIEENDVDAVLERVDPSANDFRSDVSTLMPMAEVEDTAATAITIEVNSAATPPRAASRFRGKVDGIHQRSGTRVFYFDQVDINWVKPDDRWLMESYQVYWKGSPIDAVGSMRGNRVAPQ